MLLIVTYLICWGERLVVVVADWRYCKKGSIFIFSETLLIFLREILVIFSCCLIVKGNCTAVVAAVFFWLII